MRMNAQPNSTTKSTDKMEIMKKGDKIRIIRMDDSNGKDQQARQMNGRVVTVKFIDGIGQIHLEESGLALIPGVDEFVYVDQQGTHPLLM